ncbi:NAD-dependent epimerase/dehydratase family protein [Pseudarthrobacter chlorophenolicus]|uniref:NAD-dependent epimerase/dehydratase family protein n=1 Tax=Pseudarthrobacter chlorophenolicus TaxID=85085 RepID=UPI0005F2B209|nr:NAD-dependent epimerase/dehydratase family protein [Pseudarthrobacter chlorophenolicus]
MTILLAGCGDLGTEAGLRFAALGHRVVGWRRSPSKLPAAIEGVTADLSSAQLPPVPADTSAVVIAVAADAPSEDAYRAAYVDGVSHVLDALERDGVIPGRVLFVSSTAVYGDAGGGWVDEGQAPEPGGFSGRVLVEAEDLLRSRLAGSGTAAVSLRLGGIYGPGRTRLIDQVRSGSAVIPEDVRYTNRIHRDDAAAAVVHLATMESAPAPVYIGVDNEAADLGSVLRFLATEMKLPEPAVGDAGPARGGNKRCSNALLRASGFPFTFPTFREGYREVLGGHGVRHP